MKTPHCHLYLKKRCTGCTSLHLPYSEQLKEKEELVRGHIEDLLTNVSALKAIIGSPAQSGMRTSVKICLHADRHGERTLGLYQQGTRSVQHVTDCMVHAPEINSYLQSLSKSPVAPKFYNHQDRTFQREKVKFLVLRSNGDGAISVVISHTGVSKEVLLNWLGDTPISIYESWLTAKDGNAPIGMNTQHLAGQTAMAVTIAGKQHVIPPTSFFQANSSLCHALVSHTASFSANGDILLDLYGGFGAYSLFAAHQFKQAIVVDGNKSAISSIPKSIRLNKIQNVIGHASYCEDFLGRMSDVKRQRVTHMIVNPPRAGLSQSVTNKISKDFFPNLQAVHYVSCNPETLARDLRVLQEGNLLIKDVLPFDMFPHTEHVETVVRLHTI